jgi:hypothetical protein
MATDAQIAANQANAQHSTGPKSETGKANSSRNATKHGMYIKHAIGMELKQLKRFHADFDPRRSRANMSPELKAFLQDRKNLQLVLNALVNL